MFCRVRPLHSQQRSARVPGMAQKTELIPVVKFDWTYVFYQITAFAQVTVAKRPKNHSFWSASASFLYLAITLLLYCFSPIWWRFCNICPVENFLTLYRLNPHYYLICRNPGFFDTSLCRQEHYFSVFFLSSGYLFLRSFYVSFSQPSLNLHPPRSRS